MFIQLTVIHESLQIHAAFCSHTLFYVYKQNQANPFYEKKINIPSYQKGVIQLNTKIGQQYVRLTSKVSY